MEIEEFSEEKICKICNQLSGLDKDPIIETEEVQAHFYCLLFSSGLGQKGKEEDGIKGFLFADIRKEIKRGARLKCVYCKKKGATVGCAEAKCKKSYHLPCGDRHDSLQQYFDQFKSFCKEHRPCQRVDRRSGGGGGKKTEKKDNICIICQEKLLRKAGPKTLWSPCCQEFFHRSCIQDLAHSAGSYNFRCPKCRSDTLFSNEMQRMGINIPIQDASWENGQNYQDIDEGTARLCHAKICFCSHEEGRAYNKEDGGLWEVLMCRGCGYRGIHAKCGGLEDKSDPEWDCYNCRDIMRDKKDKKSRATKSDAGNSSTAPTKPPAAQPVEPPQKPQRLFDALLATLPHLQDMENALETKQQDGYRHLELSITPVGPSNTSSFSHSLTNLDSSTSLSSQQTSTTATSPASLTFTSTSNPAQTTSSKVVPSSSLLPPHLSLYHHQSGSLGYSLTSSAAASLAPVTSNLAPICSTLVASTSSNADQKPRPQLTPTRRLKPNKALMERDGATIDNNVPDEKPSLTAVISGEKPIIKDLYDYSLEDVIRSRLGDNSDICGGTTISIVDRVNGLSGNNGGSVSITGVLKGHISGVGSGKNGFASRNGFTKVPPIFRLSAGDAGGGGASGGGNQRKMTEFFNNRKS